jgi:hypothetical protein
LSVSISGDATVWRFSPARGVVMGDPGSRKVVTVHDRGTAWLVACLEATVRPEGPALGTTPAFSVGGCGERAARTPRRSVS